MGRFQSRGPSSGGTRAEGAQELLTGRHDMSDDSKVGRAAEQDEPQDEVEAHKSKVAANDEPAAEGDDEVEAHRHIRTGEPDNKLA